MVKDWFEERLKLGSTLSWFLYRRVPRGVGWWYTLGSATLVVFIFLLFTGLFLMLNYTASPAHAYDSVQYIINQVTFGSFIRSVHFWSASAMILLLGIHALRVFFMASYRYPRELTWVIGVLLILLVMGSAFTGYLLPWDQRAYWATNVGAGISGQVPLIGPWVQQALIGGTEIGTLTLTRFYTFHVGALPALIILFIGFHIFMVIRQGISAPPKLTALRPSRRKTREEMYREMYEASKEGGEYFYPETISKDSLVALLVTAGIVILAIVRPAGLEAPADPTSTTYNPRPEWYFLFFFEFLKLFPGSLEAVAAIIVPLLALVILAVLPFLNQGLDRRWTKRKTVSGVGVLALAGLIILEITGALSAPAQPAGEVQPLVQEGRQVYEDINCSYCHSIRGIGGAVGPDLSNIGSERSKEELTQYLQDPDSMVPDTLHPKLQFTPHELEALVAYLETLGAEVSYSPEAPILFEQYCSACHMINGEGGTLGPDLSTVGSRRSLEFLEAFTRNPRNVISGTTMPGFENTLTEQQIRDIAAYMYSLKRE